MTDEIMDFLNKEMDNVVISMDGRPEVHDRMRPTVNGKGSYELIAEKAKRFAEKRGQRQYYVRGTFTGYNKDFGNDVLFLADQGFEQISVEPVVTDPSCEYALKEEDLPQIMAEYDRLAQIYLDRRANGKWFNFFHFMIDLAGGPCAAQAPYRLRRGQRVRGRHPRRGYLSLPPVRGPGGLPHGQRAGRHL